ncbi:hypothetical protein N7582_000636 [Saccharomyces uvarum]|uniref:Uncharacterized protein n=1 Tax=Saccharomyces uvarum TaxID=230603 RepID=A0AA35JCJ6_SACUV|nr:hypothetical protein N7582_000636 [Saccharomyces uvarum]CAI4056518.1 hypothetical protein SUVC_02G5680 [Saccharomyces uvarum]
MNGSRNRRSECIESVTKNHQQADMQPITTVSAAPKDKTSTEKKDNYIIKGVFWDPACIIV